VVYDIPTIFLQICGALCWDAPISRTKGVGEKEELKMNTYRDKRKKDRAGHRNDDLRFLGVAGKVFGKFNLISAISSRSRSSRSLFALPHGLDRLQAPVTVSVCMYACMYVHTYIHMTAATNLPPIVTKMF
jgi:hypothetical protein